MGGNCHAGGVSWGAAGRVGGGHRWGCFGVGGAAWGAGSEGGSVLRGVGGEILPGGPLQPCLGGWCRSRMVLGPLWGCERGSHWGGRWRHAEGVAVPVGWGLLPGLALGARKGLLLGMKSL